LLAGVADALATTVLPELAPGPARRQVQAAIGICRRVAGALPGWAPHLVEETRDVAATLTRLTSAGNRAVPPPDVAEALAADLAAAEGLPAGPLPSLDELGALDRRLQDALARLVGAAAGDGGGGDPPGVEAELRALLGRLVARQVALGLSPWEG
jgi:hypothetical protein